MRRLLLLALTPALAVAAGCARTPAQIARDATTQQATEEALQRQLAGLTPGQPESCLSPGVSRSGLQTRGYGPTILYIAGRDLIYRNDTTGGCENIARGDILVTRELQGRPCTGDIATTVDQTSRSVTGSCALREFVPYRRAK